MINGYVYSGILSMESLGKFIKEFFSGNETFYIKEVINEYKPTEPEIFKKGRVFSEKGEVRWEEKNGWYHALILIENRLANLPDGISEIDEDWLVENMKLHLVNLQMRHISPCFKQYPKDAEYIETSVYKRSGVPTFISPRSFVK
ncbi:MAG: hypothetical protein L6265_06920 [Thermoplasmatales archaeon]|nr:hypothetical protein [Candidatus Methanoperedenaceae archaeon]MCG2826305.1 hypothetical protein [Thermoplasmatales archaeon]